MRDESMIVGFVKGLLATVDGVRRVAVNLFFVAIMVVMVVVVVVSESGPDIESPSALVIAPAGRLVEELSGDPMSRALAQLQGGGEAETLLKDVLDAVELAAVDERIQVLHLDLRQFEGAGLSKLQEVRAAIKEFQTTGKKVVASADVYGQGAYYLAAGVDEVYVHRMGLVLIEGFGVFPTYYKDGLDRLGVDVNVFKVGEYKSAVEPFLRNDMSPEAEEANRDWVGDLWQGWLGDVAADRGMRPAQLEEVVLGFGERLRAAGGDGAKAALAAGLVDRVVSRDELRDRLVELVGEDEDTHLPQQVAMAAYLEEEGEDRFGRDASGPAVAVVVARGDILDGSQPPGAIGGDSTSLLVRQARHDEDVKAVVLRVDSGGGSAFASELIRRELELTRAAGKPVVVSMGSVAASGGYWVAMASDRVFASATTITGSIGIFGIIPTFQRPMETYLGMRVDGFGTTPLAGALRLDRALPPEVGAMVQAIIERGYEEFLSTVGSGRSMSRDEVDAVARGRVWSGQDALELGLVDELGDLDRAVAAAATLASLEEGYAVRWVEREVELKDRILGDLLGAAAEVLGPRDVALAGRRSGLASLVRAVDQRLAVFARLNDPNGVYALSLVETD